MPYLVCDKCNAYYKLQKGESIRDFSYCECGNKLKYYEYIGDYTQRPEDSDIKSKNGIMNLWTGQSTGIKLASILVIILGILIVTGVSGVFNNDNANKPTLLVLYAPWCSSCDKYEETLSDPDVKKKIDENYNFHKLNIDWNSDIVKKYAENGQLLVPTTIILDKDGNIVKRYEGYMDPDQLLGVLS